PDGSYTIPDGNLFPKDGSAGKPELYVMGTRNPFRYTIDAKTGWLYWGDVGPDAGKDSTLGPQSYDEWNQARTPGNYGWPYFEANNIAYPDFNFETLELGPKFDPEHPINDSPNNTGPSELPPARPAMIWYPYGKSNEFPMLGTGSRSAMAGPVYYSDLFDAENKFPDYYNGKLFIYEWARSWIKLVSFDEDGNVRSIEPFLSDIGISKPIDMEFGKDGSLYMLEYGANYFADNDDARLVKITFQKGNKVPVAVIQSDVTTGGAPLSVQFSGLESFDYDKGDKLSYVWKLNGDIISEQAEFTHTFESPGIYPVELTVTDNGGDKGVAQTEIRAGNFFPTVSVDLGGNKSFYFGNKSRVFKVDVSDKEDGNTREGTIDKSAVQVSFEYLKNGLDLANLGEDFFSGNSKLEFVEGKTLIEGSDCKSCHHLTDKSIGPSYNEIAERYKDNYLAVAQLAEKIRSGGSGNWGQNAMAAHPQHSIDETTKMTQYILSLAGGGTKSIGTEGELALDEHGNNTSGMYVFNASYLDQGANGIEQLVGRKVYILRKPMIEAESYETGQNIMRQRPQGGEFGYVDILSSQSFLQYGDIDLNGIKKVVINVRVGKEGKVKLLQGGMDGTVAGEVALTSEWDYHTVEILINSNGQFSEEPSSLYLLFESPEASRRWAEIDWIKFEN
ncbi:MAG: PKD domain-containing protein, partial [Cyclobacteriaceae bacterium]|nr:PKD domain-containing protein [Cyclobacteriaceae bacterium]